MTEKWRVIENFPDYSVSNLGRVKSPRKILKNTVSTYDYLRVGLSSSLSKNKKMFVHRLVAMAFIPNSDSLPEVNHIDGDKANNVVENLEWCTSSQNQLHAYRTGLQIHVHGSGHFASKITEKDVLEIRRLYKVEKIFQYKIAERFGIIQQNVSLICSGKAWAHVPEVSY